jgi:hypothetical protein
MANFREAFTANVPTVLADDDGMRLMFTFGVLADELEEWIYHGVFARFPAYGTDDSLSAIGRDRQIVRGFVESTEVYQARLVRWLDSHKLGGNPFELLERLAAYLFPFAVRMRIVNSRGSWYTRNADGTTTFQLGLENWNWSGDADSAWSRFWVIIYPGSTGLWTTEGDWGIDADTWGDGGVWGFSASPAQVSSIREIIRAGKPPWAQCTNIIVAFDDASFDPASPEPDGLWGDWGKYVGGVKVSSRLGTARYCEGTTTTAIDAGLGAP